MIRLPLHLILLIPLVAACAAQRAPSSAAPAVKRSAAAQPPPAVSRKVLVRTAAPPRRIDTTALEEQNLGDTVEVPPDLPPPDAEQKNDLQDSLAPQIKNASSPSAAAALRLVDEGRVEIQNGRYDQARDRLERSVAVDPSSFYGYYYLARLSYETQDYSQAIAFANRATALGARAERPWLSRAYTLQGEIFEKVGRFPDARTAYQRAVQADPKNLTAYVGRARLTPQQPVVEQNADEDPWR